MPKLKITISEVTPSTVDGANITVGIETKVFEQCFDDLPLRRIVRQLNSETRAKKKKGAA